MGVKTRQLDSSKKDSGLLVKLSNQLLNIEERVKNKSKKNYELLSKLESFFFF